LDENTEGKEADPPEVLIKKKIWKVMLKPLSRDGRCARTEHSSIRQQVRPHSYPSGYVLCDDMLWEAASEDENRGSARNRICMKEEEKFWRPRYEYALRFQGLHPNPT
jgi:hypothetical protein